ncbi:uncharacterized protein LOC116754576 [Phocoena sinus]|uniref:uncharacterized protein LOC116754576 n=1 Tax=Phocoena sinus TaxID=42100 RepID=UPI0013C41C79|nr:uncharacterized protein LOC116754576 [Phocoena sinus]
MGAPAPEQSPGPQRVARAHTEEGEERSLPEPCAVCVYPLRPRSRPCRREELRLMRGNVTCPRPHSCEGHQQDWQPGRLAPAHWRAVTARKETTLFTANLQSDGVETDPSMFLPDETGNSFHRKGLVYALGVCEIDDCTAFLPLPCPAQGYHVALPRPPSCSGQSWAPHASPCTPGLLTSEAPEWGGAIWGQDKKSQPSKEGGCLGSGGFTAFLQTAENFRWPELRQAAETLRSLSRRDERGNCGIFITRQLGLREVY